MFAKKFDLDINIHIIYSVNLSDPYLYDFLNSFKDELDMKTMCPINYFSKLTSKLENIEELTLEEVLSILSKRELRLKKIQKNKIYEK